MPHMHSSAFRPRRIARLAATAGLAAAALAPAAHAAPTPAAWVGAASATLDAGGTQSPTNCYRCVVLPHGADGKPIAATETGVVTKIEAAGFTGKLTVVALRPEGTSWRIVRSGDLAAAPAGRGTLYTRVPVRAGDVLGIAVFGGNVGLVDAEGGTGFDRLGNPTGLSSFDDYVFGTSIPAAGGLTEVDVKARFGVAPDPDGDGFVDNAGVNSIYYPTGDPLASATGTARVKATQQVARHIDVPVTCLTRNVLRCDGFARLYTARLRGHVWMKDKDLGGMLVGPKAGATQTIALFETAGTAAGFKQVFATNIRHTSAPRVILEFTSIRPGGGTGRALAVLG